MPQHTPHHTAYSPQHYTNASPHTQLAKHTHTSLAYHLTPPAPVIVTPVSAHTLASLLAHIPDRDFVHYLTHGFHFRFSTGYIGPHTTRHATNLQSALARPHVITEYLAKECTVHHKAGPFSSAPIPTFIVSPFGTFNRIRLIDADERFQHNFQHPFSVRQEGGPNHTTGILWYPP